jgi:large subunit ribosomal protein L18
MTVATRPAKRLRRRRRVRAKITGTAERPRISVFRSNRGVFAQLIDDTAGRTLAAVNWTEEDLRSLPRMEQATRAGALLAERAKAAGVETAVFDRGGYR